MLYTLSERVNQMKADKNNNLSPSADDDLRLRQATFRQLHKIVEDEMKKPITSQDTDLITECVHMMNELKGGNNLTSEEITQKCSYIISQNTHPAPAKRLKFKPVIVAACLVCTIFTCGLAVYAVNPVFRDWIIKIVSLAPGTAIEENGIKYINQGEQVVYDSIGQCIEANSLDIYFPSVLPDAAHINQLQFVTLNGTDTLWFIFDDSKFSFDIQFNSNYVLGSSSDYELYPFLGYTFYCTENSGIYFASAYIDDNLYTISAPSHNDLTMIIDNLKGSLPQ